jgi:hypothetical protein
MVIVDQGIELIDEDQGWGVDSGLIEEVMEGFALIMIIAAILIDVVGDGALIEQITSEGGLAIARRPGEEDAMRGMETHFRIDFRMANDVDVVVDLLFDVAIAVNEGCSLMGARTFFLFNNGNIYATPSYVKSTGRTRRKESKHR